MFHRAYQQLRSRFYDSHPNLPLDPDSEQAYRPRTMHTDWLHIAVVAFGAFFGTLARYYVGEIMTGDSGSWPWSIFFVNILGAFILGVILQTLLRHGKDEGRKRALRLMLGTGFLGSFTTYSSLAAGVVLLARGGDVSLAVSYALISVVLGVLAAAAGIQVATINHKRRVRV